MISSEMRVAFPEPEKQPLENQFGSIQDQPYIANHLEFFEANHQQMRSYEQLRLGFLDQSGISALQRNSLKNWIMEEMAKFHYLRETYTSASKFIDIFLLKQTKKFSIKSLQHLGISCWILATKICGERVPPFNFQSYNQNQIWQFQNQICLLLDFKLHFINYPCFAGIITSLWDIFVVSTNQNIFHTKYFEEKQKSVLLYRNFLQLLDGVDLVPKCYAFNLQELVLNCFYLENLYNCSGIDHPKTENQIKQILSSCKEYTQIFDSFHKFLNKRCSAFRDSKIQEKCLSFIIPFFPKVARIQELTKWEIQKIHLIRHMQTQNKQMQEFVSKNIKRLNE